VGPSSVQVGCNGRTFLEWNGDAQQLSADAAWQVPDVKKPTLGTWDGGYRVRKLEIAPPGLLQLAPLADASGPPPVVSEKFQVVNLLVPTLVPAPGPMLVKNYDDSKAIEHGWQWKMRGLRSPTALSAQLQIPYLPPEEYVLTTAVATPPESASLRFVLPIGGRHACVVIDSGGVVSGLERIDGKSVFQNETARGGKLLDAMGRGKAIVSLSVRHAQGQGNVWIHGSVNDTTFLDWTGDAQRLSVPDPLQAADPSNGMVLGVEGGSCLFEQLKLLPISGEGTSLAGNGAGAGGMRQPGAPGVGLGRPPPGPSGFGTGGPGVKPSSPASDGSGLLGPKPGLAKGDKKTGNTGQPNAKKPNSSRLKALKQEELDRKKEQARALAKEKMKEREAIRLKKLKKSR
jgi:hypothetical protein